MKRITILILAIFLLLAVCGNRDAKAQKDGLTLEVALFPYVPDPARFQTAVRDTWEREHPDISLHFVEWDAYTSDPDSTLDVFSFDGVFLSSFAEKGYLLPIPPEKIQEREDLIPFTLAGCTCEGKLYALPQLLCADFLYTRKDDTALSGITDVMTLYDILGDRITQGVTPEENEGLLVDLSDAFFTKTVMYLDALMDKQQNYTDYNELPDTTNLSEQVLALLKTMRRMGGEEQINFKPENDDEFVRARWFAEGKGRALIAYSEAMSAMEDRADDVIVRLFSYGTEKNIPLFYTDMVGISSNIGEDKKELALELANVLISEEVLTEMSRPVNDDDYPQYLLVARKSVYDALSRDYPIYKLLKDIVNHKENHVFRMGADAKVFILDMEKTLSQYIGQDNISPNYAGVFISTPSATDNVMEMPF